MFMRGFHYELSKLSILTFSLSLDAPIASGRMQYLSHSTLCSHVWGFEKLICSVSSQHLTVYEWLIKNLTPAGEDLLREEGYSVSFNLAD